MFIKMATIHCLQTPVQRIAEYSEIFLPRDPVYILIRTPGSHVGHV